MKFRYAFLFLGFFSGLLGSWVYDRFVRVYLEPPVAVRDSNGAPSSSDVSLVDFSSEGKKRLPSSPHIITGAPTQEWPDLRVAAQKSTESVVFIRTIAQSQYWTGTWMDWFFGGPETNHKVEAGSGVIYTKAGHIITNHHVIKGANQIEVVHKKRTYAARLVGADPSTDIAVLKVEDPKGFSLLPIGDSDKVSVGEWVLAVGNPFNLTSTVTAGIVSAKGRNINLLKERFPIESFIQTDAAINPGNSGGALVNASGELVGINTAILSQTGSYTGYGFAVPVNVVRKVAEDLIRYRKVQRAYTGLVLSDLDEKVADRLDYPGLDGVWVRRALSKGAADRGNIKVDDVIIRVNGRTIRSQTEWEEQIGYSSPGDVWQLDVWSKGRMLKRKITLLNSEGTTSILRRHLYYAKSLRAELEVVSNEEKRLLGIKQGVRIVRAHAGILQKLPQGLIITHINQQPIDTPKKLETLLGNLRGYCYIQGIDSKGNRVTYRANLG